MIQFDWQDKIKDFVFKSWLENGGEGVKIAVLDTGVDLSHMALKHLDKAGRKFNVALPNFNPAAPSPNSNDDVTDLHKKKGHGTQCVSVLSSAAEGANDLRGLAPKAEIFILKVNTTNNKFFLVKDFLKGLEAAVKLGVDVVVASLSYLPGDVAQEGVAPSEVDRIFKLVADAGVLLFTALPNKDDANPWMGLAASSWPSLRPESANVGAISKVIFDARRAEIDAEPNIHFVVGNSVSAFCKIKNEYVQEAVSSSYGTYLVAGVAALYLASIKKREKENYKPRPQAEVLVGMSQKFSQLKNAANWDDNRPVLYKTSAVASGKTDEDIT